MEGVNRAYTKILTQVTELLKHNEEKKITSLLEQQDVHVLVDLLHDLSEHRRKIFLFIPSERQAQSLLLSAKQTKKKILKQLPPSVISRFLHFTDEDDAADIMQMLPVDIQQQVASRLQESKREKIEQLLSFDPETAGGIMDLNFILVRISFSFKDVLEKINYHMQHTREVPVVVVTDNADHVLGVAPFKNLLGVPLTASIKELTHSIPQVIYTVDQEVLIKKLKSTHQDIVVVVDELRHPIGIVHPKDILRVLEEEATEDLYKFAGVKRDEDVFDTPTTSVRFRYKWLILNLATAFLAAFVVSMFQDTISRLVILAAYMPIVAGMGGNAGTQTLAVVVRGIALGQVRIRHAIPLIKKEILAGFMNGIIVGVIVSLVVTLWHGNALLGVILGVSIMLNLVVAGLFGAIIPLTLRVLKLDPALSSSVFLTTATDIFGFLIFLGLASAFLL